MAQAYASMTDRPFADFDVYVPASHYDAARAVPRHGQWRHAIDLHRGAAYLDDTSFDCLLADAATVVINDVPVRTFSEEHHLRLVCLHALAEGLMSPRWLCDVAVLVLARSPRFDWRRFEAGEAWRTRWAYVAIDLARQIFALGDDSRWPRPRPEPPGWAVRATLATWGEWRATKGMRQPMTRVRARPVTLLRALRDRWPSPLEAVAGVGCGIPQRSAFGHQLIECVRRTRRFVAEPSADPAPRLPA